MLEAQEVKYEEFKIISQDGSNAVDAYSGKFRVIRFNYYETILSPYITGNVTIVSTTDAAVSTEDNQQRSGSLYNFLPLSAGCVITAKFRAGVGNETNFLDFSTDPFKRLYVTEVSVINKSPTSETIVLKFISRIGWLNETTRITKHYKGKITDSVQKILKDDDDLKFAFRHFPIKKKHPHAEMCAEAALCAGAQDKFWGMHDLLFDNSQKLSRSKLDVFAENLELDMRKFHVDLESHEYLNWVNTDFRSGVKHGVDDTPTFFMNEKKYEGDLDYQQIKEFIAKHKI